MVFNIGLVQGQYNAVGVDSHCGGWGLRGLGFRDEGWGLNWGGGLRV